MSTPSEPAPWSTCANPKFGFWFNYPHGWVSVPDIPSIVYHPAHADSFVASEGGKTQRVYSPALTLMMMPRGKTAGQSPAEVFEGFKRLLPSFFPRYVGQNECTFLLSGGHEAREVSFTFLKGGRPFVAILAHIVQPNYIFFFDGSSLEKDFVNYEAVFRQAIRSLRFTDSECDAYEIDSEGIMHQTTATGLLARERARQEHERAVGIMDRGEYRTALAMFERVLKSVSDDPDPMLMQNIAVCHAQLGEFKQALSVLEDAMRRWPENTRLQQNYAAIKRDAR